jgi:DNA-binding MarR family transcriptional regulator
LQHLRQWINIYLKTINIKYSKYKERVMINSDTQANLEESIMSASRIMVNILAESLIHVGEEQITVPQFRILDMINNLTDKPTEIARMLDVSPPAISFLLEKLEEKGLIERNLGTADRRRIELALTEKGVGIVRRVNTYRKKYLKKVLQLMDLGSRSQLESSLAAFTESYLQLKNNGPVDRDA